MIGCVMCYELKWFAIFPIYAVSERSLVIIIVAKLIGDLSFEDERIGIANLNYYLELFLSTG